MRSAGNEECGKRGKCGVWKTRSVENMEFRKCFTAISNIFFQAIKNVSKKVNKRIKRVKHYCQ